MKKNILILIMTVCLVVTCSISLSAFRSNAKDGSTETSYKYYKSIIVSNNDTLWTIAEKYMDDEHYDSINDYIREVKSMNTLKDDVIHYGEYLVIPYYDNNYVGQERLCGQKRSCGKVEFYINGENGETFDSK